MKVKHWFIAVLTGLLASCSAFDPAPLAPSKLRILADDEGFLRLSWENPETLPLGLSLEVKLPGAADFREIAELPITTQSWTHAVQEHGLFAFRLRVASRRRSTYSEIVEVASRGQLVASNWDNTGWNLAWSDEFNSDSLDTANWTAETGRGNGGWGNNELQYYRAENVSFADDNGRRAMIITAREEQFGGAAFTSARIKTQGKQAFQYGRIEAAIKAPFGQGIWPAFWMLGANFGSVGWPFCGEIDIMEMVGGADSRDARGDRTVHGTVHYADLNGRHQYRGGHTSLPAPGRLADNYRLFGIEWNSTEIQWFIDGKHFHSETITSSARTELQNPHFLLLNLAVGGNWPGDPDKTTEFPQTMSVDWVRVYQLPQI